MGITRTEHDLDIADLEGTLEDTILTVNVAHTAALTDTVATLLSDTAVLRHGQEVTFAGFSGWYVTKTNLKYLSSDSQSRTFTQELEISRIRPTLKSEEPNPLMRSVRRVRATIRFDDQPALIDAVGRPVVNAVGEWVSGFSVRVPITEIHYEWNSETLPAWLLTANGCINANAFTIGTLPIPKYCARLIVDEYPLPDNIKEENGVQFYPLFWRLEIDPRTHLEHKLNQGFHEFVYTDISGNKVSPTATRGDSPGQLKYIRKRAILDDVGEPVKTQVMLDSYGRAIRDVALTNTPLGFCTTVAGTSTITLNSGTFADTDRGLFVGLRKTGYEAGFLSTIESVSGSTATVSSAVPFDATNATIYKPGISTLSWLPSPIADFAALGIPL